jgi:hypothetical protein
MREDLRLSSWSKGLALVRLNPFLIVIAIERGRSSSYLL